MEEPGKEELAPVTCSWCSWSGFVRDLHNKQVIIRTMTVTMEEGVACCPRCGSHTSLEY